MSTWVAPVSRDRWADLAPALQSLGWNYGPGWEPSFLRAYGAEPDQPKRLFYSALWDGVGEELGRFPTPSAATADPGASPG
jgi:kanamycin kinase